MSKENEDKSVNTEGASSKLSDTERILGGLELKDGDLEHIRIDNDGSVRFELSLSVGRICVNGKEIDTDEGLEIELNEAIIEFFGGLLSGGGFRDTHFLSIPPRLRQDVEFYRDYETDEEARDAIKWLVEFKKRLGS